MYKNFYISETDILKFIARFNILRDKINFDIPLNDLDIFLIEILEEYDFYLEKIDNEQKEKNKYD